MTASDDRAATNGAGTGGAAPTLRTGRLLLRPFRPDDLPAYTAIRAEPDNVRFLPGGAAAAPAAARRVIDTWNAAAWESGHVPWAVEHQGRLIGHLGLRHLPELGETELLYMLDRAFRGRGLATEGALAAIAFARDRLRLGYLVALAMPQNTASTAVMRRCGFTLEGDINVFGLNAVRYGLRLQDSSRD